MEYLALGLAVIVIIKLILIKKYRKIIRQQAEEICLLQRGVVSEQDEIDLVVGTVIPSTPSPQK